jgi:1-acyl-sn-glycerol-3-phosphate acyltransferase
VEGQEHIPRHGPFLVVVNHYSRPGLDAWWGPLLIQVAVSRRRPGEELRWPMADAWTYPPEDRLGNWALAPATRWLFPRVARMYGLVPMPPMPPRPHEVVDRARAVRELLALARDPRALIAMAPEGRDNPHGGLVKPPPGVGRLILQLTRTGRPVLPVGVAERDGALTATFGRVFELDVVRAGDKNALDAAVSTRVMVAVGRLLPPRMWGEYADEIMRKT